MSWCASVWCEYVGVWELGVSELVGNELRRAERSGMTREKARTPHVGNKTTFYGCDNECARKVKMVYLFGRIENKHMFKEKNQEQPRTRDSCLKGKAKKDTKRSPDHSVQHRIFRASTGQAPPSTHCRCSNPKPEFCTWKTCLVLFV